MSNILIQLTISLGILKFYEKFNKNIFNYLFIFIFIFFIVLISIFTLGNNTEYEFSENNFNSEKNIENFNNSFSCKINVNQITKKLEQENINFSLKRNSISFLPEIKNFNCFSKVTSIQIISNVTIINVGTSTTLLRIFNTFFGLIFFIILFNQRDNKTKVTYSILYLILDYLINIYLFEGRINLIYILLKLLTIYLIYYLFIKSKELNIRLELGIIFIILLFSTKAFDLNLTPDDLYYLGYSLRGDTPYSAFFGNNQWFFYSGLINFFYNIFGIYSKVILEILLAVWLTFLIHKYSEYFNFNKKIKFLFPILLITNQSFAAGDQLWGSPVPKSFCYFSILTAIYYLINKKYLLSNIFFIISVYFHLAAFVIWLPFIAYIFIFKIDLNQIIKSALTVLFSTAPLIFTLFKTNFIDLNNKNLRYQNLEYIIKDFMPFHVYPFVDNGGSILSINPMWKNNFTNILIFISLVIIYSLFFNEKKDDFFKLIQFTTVVLIVYLVINFVSPINSFILLQPYKIISLLALLTVVFILKSLNNLPSNNIFTGFFGILVLISFFNINYSISNTSYEDERSFISSPKLRGKIEELNPKVVLTPLYYQGSVQSNLSDIEIKTEIDTYVTYHYFPQSISATQEWKNRIKNLENFYQGDCRVFDFLDNYIFLDYKSNNECGTLLDNINDIYIYKNKNN